MMPKNILIAVGCLLAMYVTLVGGAEAGPVDPYAQAREAITKAAQAFIAAYEKEDATAVASFWTPDGDFMVLSGRVVTGRQAIAEEFADVFSQNERLTIRIEVASVRFPTPDTAIENGVTSVLSPDGSQPNRAHYTNFLVKQDGQWLLSSVRESPYVPPSNYEHLRPLEWLIGEWVEDDKDGHGARVAFQWTPDQNFIIAFRAVGVNGVLLDNGSQRIGWDPVANVLRSWSFESDGSFGEGAWVQEGDNKWVNRVSSNLRTGSPMTATTTVTRVDANTLTFQSTEHVVDGKTQPDSPVVTMKRVN